MFSAIWPTCGWMRDGSAYRLPLSALLTNASASSPSPGALFRTPLATDSSRGGETFDQVRLDRWLKFGDRPDEPERLLALRRGVRDAFTPTDPAWRRGIVAHARQIQLQLLDGVTAWTD